MATFKLHRYLLADVEQVGVFRLVAWDQCSIYEKMWGIEHLGEGVSFGLPRQEDPRVMAPTYILAILSV